MSNRFAELNEQSLDESKFVENTPVRDNEEIAQSDNGVNVNDNAENESYDERSIEKGIPAIIESDMKFLNDSWANMVEDNNDEMRLLHELQKTHVTAPNPNEGFQVVTSKKKKQKKFASQKKGYETRSKDGPSNPSK